MLDWELDCADVPHCDPHCAEHAVPVPDMEKRGDSLVGIFFFFFFFPLSFLSPVPLAHIRHYD